MGKQVALSRTAADHLGREYILCGMVHHYDPTPCGQAPASRKMNKLVSFPLSFPPVLYLPHHAPFPHTGDILHLALVTSFRVPHFTLAELDGSDVLHGGGASGAGVWRTLHCRTIAC